MTKEGGKYKPKISDFGLSRTTDANRNSTDIEFPVKWSSTEVTMTTKKTS